MRFARFELYVVKPAIQIQRSPRSGPSRHCRWPPISRSAGIILPKPLAQNPIPLGRCTWSEKVGRKRDILSQLKSETSGVPFFTLPKSHSKRYRAFQNVTARHKAGSLKRLSAGNILGIASRCRDASALVANSLSAPEPDMCRRRVFGTAGPLPCRYRRKADCNETGCLQPQQRRPRTPPPRSRLNPVLAGRLTNT